MKSGKRVYCGNEINVNATDKAEKEDNPVQEEKAESHVHESEKKDDDVRESAGV